MGGGAPDGAGRGGGTPTDGIERKKIGGRVKRECRLQQGTGEVGPLFRKRTLIAIMESLCKVNIVGPLKRGGPVGLTHLG